MAFVSQRLRIALLAGVAVLVAITVWTVVGFHRYSKVVREFPSISIGDSRSSVAAKLGNPNYYSGNCGVIHFPDKTCALEYVYSHPFAPLVPEYYIVSFSSDDHVIEASPWSSP
jgi:hypothetical protein